MSFIPCGGSQNPCCPETNTLLTQMVALLTASPTSSTPVVELDVVVSNWLPICVGGVSYYVREVELVNNTTGVKTFVAKEYKLGASGAISTTVPTGTITEGLCPIASQPATFSNIVAEVGAKNKPTGIKVVVITSVNPLTGVPTNTYYNLATGAVWAGNPTTQLGALQDYDQTLEPKEMCDNGTTFLRWFAIENNTLSGAVVDTDLSGATYTVIGTPVFGACPLVKEDYKFVLDGHIQNISAGSAVGIGLTEPCNHITVTNGTNGILTGKVDFTTTPNGNSLFYCGAGQSQDINFDQVLIKGIEFSTTDVNQGFVILNAQKDLDTDLI